MSYKVKLEIFEGPLDLLLYLVKQNHFEIAQIPIAQITEQYLRYLELMQALDLEIAGEFLVMAATLMQIKSRMLLPPEAVPVDEADEVDPAQELIRRLMEYQKFKEAAEALSAMEKNRFVQVARPVPVGGSSIEVEEMVDASLFDLLNVFSQFMAGGITRELIHEVMQDEFTVEDKIEFLRSLVLEKERVSFQELFQNAKNKLEVISTFLAVLELIRLKEIAARQTQLFGEIMIVRNAPQSESEVVA